MRRIVVNADDFGRSAEINAAVLKAHREGILTSASLMVTGDAVQEAIELAHGTPALAVGLHVVLVDGRSALSHAEIPHLVDPAGNFARTPLGAGLDYFASRQAREELRLELRAQFERFAATGLRLHHVDGHLHMHLHPAVLDPLLSLAVHYGARRVRLPRDDLRLSLRCDRRHAWKKAAWAASFGLLCRYAARRLRQFGLPATSRTYGLMQTGHMHQRYVVELLRQIRCPSTEIYFHPTIGRRTDEFGPNPGDLESLVSPAVRQVIEEEQIELETYPAPSQACQAEGSGT